MAKITELQMLPDFEIRLTHFELEVILQTLIDSHYSTTSEYELTRKDLEGLFRQHVREAK